MKYLVAEDGQKMVARLQRQIHRQGIQKGHQAGTVVSAFFQIVLPLFVLAGLLDRSDPAPGGGVAMIAGVDDGL